MTYPVTKDEGTTSSDWGPWSPWSHEPGKGWGYLMRCHTKTWDASVARGRGNRDDRLGLRARFRLHRLRMCLVLGLLRRGETGDGGSEHEERRPRLPHEAGTLDGALRLLARDRLLYRTLWLPWDRGRRSAGAERGATGEAGERRRRRARIIDSAPHVHAGDGYEQIDGP